MASNGAWTSAKQGETQVTPPARVRYDLRDIPALLWRERGLMLVVFLVVLVLGMLVALSMKTLYRPNASLLVRLGQEYVYEPRAGDAGRGAVPDADSVIQAETEILQSAHLKQRVIDRLGLAYIYPELAKVYASGGVEGQQRALATAVHTMGAHLKIQTAPDTPIIKLSFGHPKSDVAAKVLNTLLEEYLVYRRDVLAEGSSPALEAQRRSFEQRLQRADDAYEQFLGQNRIGDFVAEKAALTQLQAQIEQQKFQTLAQLQDRQGRLAVLERQLVQVPAEVGLSRDQTNVGAERLAQMRVQREDLLSRYRSDATPVKELDAQIAQMEAGVAAGRTVGDGVRRIGVNPVYQTLQTERIQLSAEVQALRTSLAELERQVGQITDRRVKFAALEPIYQELSLDRDVLQSNVRDFTVREQQSRAAQEIAAFSNDSVRVVERALPPLRGSSLKAPVAAIAMMFAAFCAACAGLLRAFLRPGLPMPRTAGRTLGLPVLGVAPVKA
jgi:uncharacterized protein involved in exopolysaccharide biosynthesis